MLSSPGTGWLPSVDAMIVDFPLDDLPYLCDRSTFIVNIAPSTLISTFFTAFDLISKK